LVERARKKKKGFHLQAIIIIIDYSSGRDQTEMLGQYGHLERMDETNLVNE